MLHTIQFYAIKYNFQFDYWIWLKSYKGFLDILFNIFLKKFRLIGVQEGLSIQVS